MAFERRRNGKLYYYRSRRVCGRVVKQYVGAGDVGRLAAEADNVHRDIRRATDRRQLEESQVVATLNDQLNELGKLVDQLIKYHLVCAGWRQHHRQWRPPKNARRNSTRR